MLRRLRDAITLVLIPAAAFAADHMELRLAGGTFRPGETAQALPSWFEPSPHATSANGQRYLVAIVAADQDSGTRRKELESAGAAVIGYLPVRGYLVRLSPEAEERVRDLWFVSWLGEIPAWLKAAPRLAAEAAVPKSTTRLRAVLHAAEPADRAKDALAGLPMTAQPAGKDGAWRLEAAVPPGLLARTLSRLAELPEVEAIEPVVPMRPLNQDAVWVHQSFVGPSPQQTPVFNAGIFGCQQVLAVADTGQDYSACFFRDSAGPPPFFNCLSAPCSAGGTNPARRKDIVYYNWSGTPTGDDDTCPALIGGSGHGTHTSGSAAGDSSPFADCAGFTTPGRNGGDGQAPGAKLIIQELGDGLEYLNNLGGTVWNLADVAYTNGARIQSFSWGGSCHDAFGQCIPGCTLPYDSFARDADLAMWTYPDLLLVTSAGNAGAFCPPPISVGTPALAKSLVTVGSLGHGSAATATSFFSSPGPVFDGRLKPTLAAQGESVVSAASDANPTSANCGTCSLDGTSMAAPTTAGLAALVREFYTAGYSGSGTRNPGSGFIPSAALVKATLLDAAVPLGGPASSPDFDSGFGRIQLNRTLRFPSSSFALRVDDNRQGLVTGGVVTHAYDVAAGTPLRATLAWSDFPAALNAATARVNELKLEVIDPAGTVWFQTLDPITGAPAQTSDPSDAHDGLNVEERIGFDAPQPGRWIIRVRGLDVPMGPQPFALVVRGALTDCAAPAAPAAPSLATPAPNQVQVSWNSVPGAAAYNVYRNLGACPGNSWVPVALGTTATSLLDSGLSGGTTWSYYVTAASDAAAACESPRSGCASVVPSGDCTLAPSFAGISSAGTPGDPTCTVELSWSAASPYCGSQARYNIYRGTSPGFVPGPANVIASCVTGTSWADTAGLAYSTTYYYVVRAEDMTTGHGGACGGGNEESNTVVAGTAPAGPPAPGTFTDDAGDTGTAVFSAPAPWLVAPSGGNLGPAVYTASSSEGICTDLTSPAISLGSPGLGPQLSFATRYNLEYDEIGIFGAEGSLGQVEIATGPGFTNWTRVPLTPGYPNVVEFPLNNCSSTANIDTYFTGFEMTWRTHTASLANWAGGDVRVRFHLSGDLLYPTGDWWVDEIQVTHAVVPGSCETAQAAPPPIPDGASVPGAPVEVSLSGSSLLVRWDASQCSAAAVNIYYGQLGDFTTFTGGVCDLPHTGSATIPVPDNIWLLVTATDGNNTDGSWARDASGAERSYAGSQAVCPAITQHAPAGTCP